MLITNDEIRTALSSLDLDTARKLVRDKLKTDADADTFYLAALVALNDKQKREFLQKALDEDPFHQDAHTEMEKLESSVIMPVKIEAAPAEIPAPVIATVQEAPANPAPVQAVAEPVKEEKSSPTYVVGRIKGGLNEATMHVIPIETGIVRTKLRKGSEVLLIARDAQMGWFQAIYPSPIGQNILGWVAASQIENINLQGSPIQAMDLPITQFEYNTRDEVLLLISELKKTASSVEVAGKIIPKAGRLGLAYMAWFAFFVGGLLLFLLGFAMAFESDISVVGISFAIVGILIVAAGWNRMSNNKRLDKEIKEQDAPLHERIRNLNMAQLSMRTDYEIMRDDQRTNMAMSAAMNLGSSLMNTAAGRYIKDRREVTIKHK